jgi:hypothetical protein
LLLVAPLPVFAQGLVVGGIGGSDAVRGTKSAPEVRFEYRPEWSLLPAIEPVAALRPWVGGEVTTRGSFWAGGGVLLDIGIGRFALVPQLGVGGYEAGNGKDLGSALQFRTGVELAYKFEDGSRVALGISHMSDAGITRRNPGTEAIYVNYQVPLTKIFGP